MPEISASGTYKYDSVGGDFSFLLGNGRERSIEITGTSFGSSCTVQFKNDADTTVIIDTVTALPYLKTLPSAFRKNIEVVFTGTPDCNLGGSNWP